MGSVLVGGLAVVVTATTLYYYLNSYGDKAGRRLTGAIRLGNRLLSVNDRGIHVEFSKTTSVLNSDQSVLLGASTTNCFSAAFMLGRPACCAVDHGALCLAPKSSVAVGMARAGARTRFSKVKTRTGGCVGFHLFPGNNSCLRTNNGLHKSFMSAGTLISDLTTVHVRALSALDGISSTFGGLRATQVGTSIVGDCVYCTDCSEVFTKIGGRRRVQTG